MAGWDVKVTGADKAASNLRKLRIRIPVAVANAFVLQAELTMTQAKRLTPVDTGRLRASGRVSVPLISSTRVVVVMGFYTNYAVYVHERLDAHHPVGQAKFLEVAVRMRERSIERALASALKAAI